MTERVLLITPAAVLDALSRAVVATDPDGTILAWNRAAELLYGWTADEALGRNIVDLLVPESAADEATAIFERVRMGGQWSGDFLTRHKDGHTVSVAILDRAVLDDERSGRGRGRRVRGAVRRTPPRGRASRHPRRAAAGPGRRPAGHPALGPSHVARHTRRHCREPPGPPAGCVRRHLRGLDGDAPSRRPQPGGEHAGPRRRGEGRVRPRVPGGLAGRIDPLAARPRPGHARRGRHGYRAHRMHGRHHRPAPGGRGARPSALRRTGDAFGGRDGRHPAPGPAGRHHVAHTRRRRPVRVGGRPHRRSAGPRRTDGLDPSRRRRRRERRDRA